MTTKRKHAIYFEPDSSLTHQSFKDECDVNNIVRAYTQTGMINHLPRTEPQYGDAPEIDFFEAARIQAGIASFEEAQRLVPEEPEPEPNEAPNASQTAPESAVEAPESTTLDGA